jgi:galactokinase
MAVEPAPEAVHLTSDRFDGVVEFPADGSQAPSDGWGRYVAAVAAQLHRRGRRPVGMTGHVTSTLPAGAGLSSSAALEVVSALALCRLADLDLAPMELAALAQDAEHQAVGVPVGIMDQAASLLGRADHAVLLDCGSLEYRHVPLPRDLSILVIDSGVSRQLEGSGYGQRRSELEAGLGALADRRPQDVDVDELDGLLAGVDDVPARRVRHVVTENARVLAAEAVLREDPVDLAELGRLFAASHASLRDEYEVSVPEVDQLVELAREHGAVAARMTGGGFGGAIVALAHTDDADSVGAAVTRAYARRCPGRAATVHRCEAADGAGER